MLGVLCLDRAREVLQVQLLYICLVARLYYGPQLAGEVQHVLRARRKGGIALEGQRDNQSIERRNCTGNRASHAILMHALDGKTKHRLRKLIPIIVD